jgi:hypothetical protein
MKSFWKRQSSLFAVALATGGALGLTGCVGTFNGGGYIDSVAGAPAKATFGGTVHTVASPNPPGWAVRMGQFQWNDHGTGVRFHVNNIEGPLFGIFWPDLFNPQANMQAWQGTYRTSAGGEGVVLFALGVEDPQWTQFFGNALNDAVFVQVLTGPYAGYQNAGLVEGGNVTFEPEE